MVGRTVSLRRRRLLVAYVAAACDGASISHTVDYDTAAGTVAALASVVAKDDQWRRSTS